MSLSRLADPDRVDPDRVDPDHVDPDHADRNQGLLRAIFDTVLDAIVLTDESGRYVDVNPAACALFALPRDRIIGRTFVELEAASREGPRAPRPDGDVPAPDRIVFERGDGDRRVIEKTAVAGVAPGIDLAILRDVTARVAAEDALRSSEARFRALIEKSRGAISLTTSDGKTRYLTPSAASVLGWEPEELATLAPREQVLPEDREHLEREIERMLRGEARELSMELRVRHLDGSIRYIEASGTNLLDDPNVRAIVANYHDVTGRKVAEAALRKSRDMLEEAQAIAHFGSWTSALGPDGGIEWSPECYRIFGVPEGSPVTVETFFGYIDPADRDAVARASRAAAEGGSPYEIEHRIRRPDGRMRWVHERAVVERDIDGKPTRMAGTVQDVTERHLALEALRTSEERYRRIIEGTTEGICLAGPSGVITFVNARMAEIIGASVAELVGATLASFFDGADRSEVEAWASKVQRGVAARTEREIRHRNGSKLWVSVQTNPLFDRERRIESVLAIVTDVSAEHRAEDARARLAAIVESSEDAILSATLDGTITTWNRGAVSLFQYSADEIVGQAIDKLIPATFSGQATLLSRIVAGEVVNAEETTRQRKDGSLVEIALRVSPIRSADGAVIGVSATAHDLTQRRANEAALRRTEEQFRQAQKMEAVGRLAGGVAHDFNNLLSVILGYATLTIDSLKVGDPLRSDLEEIEKAARRATALTRQLLAFSRRQVLQPRAVDLNQVLSEMKPMLVRLLGEDIVLSLLTASDLGRVLADPGQVEQVVMNLAVNARDAMPDGGTLTIETSNVRLDGAALDSHLGVDPGDYAMFAVCDTGVGMDAETQTRIFEPFFSTKEPGKGTGLGLSTVFGIVQQSGGAVGVYSEPGHGTTFKVYLPRTDRHSDSTLPARASTVLRGTETILLVEDEDQVRAVACAILRRQGYNVLETSNAGEAYLVATDFPAKIHLLLTDVVMPRMSGRKLVEMLSPLRPEMKVLFASGYTNDAIVHHGILDAGVSFIQKPFTPDSLAHKVREVLDAH